MKKVLYLGTQPYKQLDAEVVHHPLIEIIPRDFSSFSITSMFQDIKDYTHLLLTSQHAVETFFKALSFFEIPTSVLSKKHFIVIGESTHGALKSYGDYFIGVAKNPTQEGVMDYIDQIDCENGYFFYPRSSLARPTLSCYLRVRKLRHQVCDIYDSKKIEIQKEIDISKFDEIIFTSPSIVRAFFDQVSYVPSYVKLTSIGPITEQALVKFR